MELLKKLLAGLSLLTSNVLRLMSLECQHQHTQYWSLKNSSDCYRECEVPMKPRLCEYEFTLVWGYTMAAQCTDCFEHFEDCNSPMCVTVDGSIRHVITINGHSPGPAIHVCHGDTVRVKVNNNLEDGAGVTIHWHGMHQKGTMWADGVPMITQCPIISENSFVYKFIADPPGTHWWHSHTGVQRGDGLYGAMIVRVPLEREISRSTYDFDLPKHYMLLNDWTSTSSLLKYTKAANNGIEVPCTYTILVNGKGRNADIQEVIPHAEFLVEQGYSYRMRVVNAAFNTCNLIVTIDSHPITVIATDGFAIEPITVDSIIITPGERLDFVLDASEVPSSYCIYVTPTLYAACPGNGTAIIKYKNTNTTKDCLGYTPPLNRVFSTFIDPEPPAITTHTFKDTHSYEPVDPALYNVDVRYYIGINMAKTTYPYKYVIKGDWYYYTCIALIGHVQFEFPDKPLIITGTEGADNICDSVTNTTTEKDCKARNNCKCVIDAERHPECSKPNICKCTNVLKVQLGEVVEIVFKDNTDIVDHQMHLHGQSFRLLTQEPYIEVDEDDLMHYDNKFGLPRVPLNESVVKDTVSVPKNGYAIIRWKADNPGYWLFHCHVEYHTLFGMVIVIQVGEDDEMPELPKNFPTCGGPWSPD